MNYLRLFFLILTTIFCLFVGELVLRCVAPPNLMNVGTTQTPKARLYGWAVQPNKTKRGYNPDTGKPFSEITNSQGWRDVEHRFSKPSGVLRILFIGDSFTWGNIPQEKLYTHRIAELLKVKGFSHVEVISIAAGGWGTDQELEVLRLEGVQYEPDIVIYQYCSNDPGENYVRCEDVSPDSIYSKKVFRYELVDGILHRIELRPRLNNETVTMRRRIKNILLKSAWIYNLNQIRYRLIESWKLWRLRMMMCGNVFQTRKVEIGKMEKTTHYSRDDIVNMISWYGPEVNSVLSLERWKLWEALVLWMKRVCQEHRARFLIFLGEDGMAVRRRMKIWNVLSTDTCGDFVILDGKRVYLDFNWQKHRLQDICARYEIPLIVPVQEYELGFYSGHPNETGNVRMAEDIVDFLLTIEPFCKNATRDGL